jgi:hypothetical protein
LSVNHSTTTFRAFNYPGNKVHYEAILKQHGNYETRPKTGD